MKEINKSFLYIDDDQNKHLLKTIKFDNTALPSRDRCGLCFFKDCRAEGEDGYECYPPEIIDECGDDDGVYYFKLIKSKIHGEKNK